MKQILSILMVAVLSLNLLYQPCVATDDKKETVSAVTQERQNDGDKAKKSRSFLWRVIKAVIGLRFGLFLLKVVYNAGSEHEKDRNESYERKLKRCKNELQNKEKQCQIELQNKEKNWKEREETWKKLDEKWKEEEETWKKLDEKLKKLENEYYKLYAEYYKKVASCNKQCNNTGNFPLDKVSKKCLKQLYAKLHPDSFKGCFNEIKDFYFDLSDAIGD